jgi:hypothetical protein
MSPLILNHAARRCELPVTDHARMALVAEQRKGSPKRERGSAAIERSIGNRATARMKARSSAESV